MMAAAQRDVTSDNHGRRDESKFDGMPDLAQEVEQVGSEGALTLQSHGIAPIKRNCQCIARQVSPGGLAEGAATPCNFFKRECGLSRLFWDTPAMAGKGTAEISA